MLTHCLALLFICFYSVLSSTQITNSEAQNLSTGYGEHTFYQFSFSYLQETLSTQKRDIQLGQSGIQVVFPPQIDVKFFPINLECYFRIGINPNSQVDCDYNSDRIVYLKTSELIQGDYNLAIGPIQNPIGVSGTSFFKLCLLFNDVQIDCNDTFGKVSFYKLPVNMTNGGVLQKSSLALNAGSSWAFTFTPIGIYDQNLYSVRVTFPKGFRTTSANCIFEGGTSEIKTKILYNQHMVECQQINVEMNRTLQKVRILNMINPSSYIEMKQFAVEILLASNNVVLERIVFDPLPVIQLDASNMSVSLEQSSYYRLSNSTFVIKFSPIVSLGSNGTILISFDDQWKLWERNCTLLTGLQRYSNQFPTCGLNSDSNSYLIKNFEDIISNNQVVVRLNAQTPSAFGNYTIKVTTLNENNNAVDVATVAAVMNSTYGSLNKFQASALVKQVKLKAGHSGSLEATFFLKNNLPSSNYNTIGRIQIKIFPKVNKPALGNGVVKCYFYGNIQATKCDFDDTSYGSHTVIDIQTPEAFDYQESQIPITITSEGSKLSSTEGIFLDPLIKRYLLHFHMFNSTNPNDKPTEVYFQEWIPDAFEIPDSDITFTPLIQERNEFTHLKFSVLHQITMTSQERNYVFRVTFMNDDQQVWGEFDNQNNNGNGDFTYYPCYLFNTSTQKEYSLLKCYLKKQNNNPYIQAVGYETLDIIKGNEISLDIPNIFIKNVNIGAQAKLRFSVMEETPGMIGEYVELYFKDFSFQVQDNSYSSYTFNPNIATTLIPNSYVNNNSDLRFQWTAGVVDPDYLVYEIDTTGFYDIQTGQIPQINCDNNVCIRFEKMIHQIVVTLQDTQNENIITNIQGLFRNPNYAGSFQFKVRAIREGRVVNKHTFFVNVNEKGIQSALFDIEDKSLVLNDINNLVTSFEENEFFIKFTTETYLPDNSLIKLSFQNVDMQQPDRHKQFCMFKSGLQPLPNSPITCSIIGNTIQITSFTAVPAKTPIQINFRLKNQGNDFSPLVSIQTYFGPQNTALVDFSYNIPSSTKSIKTNNVKAQNTFKILPEAIRCEFREKLYVGPVIIDYSLGTLKPLNWIRVSFHQSFRTPREYGNDSLICLVNEIRFDCSYSINPLTVVIGMKTNTLPLSSQYRLSISTEYVSPLDGILHPATEGFYPINIELQDELGVLSQQTRFMFIKGQKLQFLYIESMIRNQKRANMFYVHFKVNNVVKSYNQGARIYIEFPTQDNQGNPMFDLDLGGYKNTGDEVGCRFVSKSKNAIGPVAKLRCRLIKSQSRGVPAIVEIINFDGLTINSEVEMWIAKVFNPPNFNYPIQSNPQVMDANIFVNIFERDLNSGDINYIHFDYFNVFMDIRDDPVLSDTLNPFYNTSSNQVWQTGSKVGDNLKSMFNPLFYDKSPFQPKDFYIIELPFENTLDAMHLHWEISTCSETNYLMCLTFPQIGWIVVRAKIPLSPNQLYFANEAIISKLPLSIPQNTTEYKSYVWQGNLFRGYVINRITPQQWMQLVGDITNAKLLQIESQYKLVKNRQHTEVNLNFTVNHLVPSYGAIQIRFGQRIQKVYPHCRSSVTVGSGLLNSLGQYGNIGCLVQDQNTWVITGFQELKASTTVMITGYIDLPQDNISGYTGDLDIITYGSHEYAGIFTLGRLIDKTLGVPNSGISLLNYVSKNLEDWDLLHIETAPLRINSKGAMRFKFSPDAVIIGNQGRMRVMFYEYSQLQYNDNRGGKFLFNKDTQYVCEFTALATKQFHGCKVESAYLDESYQNHFNLFFQLIPNSDLLTHSEYILKITTLDGNGKQEGLTFPSTALPYKVDVSYSVSVPTGESSYNYHQHLYYQIYGQPFAYLKFTSYITLNNEMNIFIVEFQPGQAVNSQDKLVIEFPTTSIDGSYPLFSDDGGLGIESMDEIKFDIIDSTFSQPSMQCRLHKGLALQKIPLKYVCTNFQNNGSPYNLISSDKMKIAFTILNPTLNDGHLSIPVQVYLERPYISANEKYVWDIIENAFYIHSWNPSIVANLNGDFNIGSVTDTVCNMNTDFKFRPRNTQNLKNKNEDAFILKFKFDLRDEEPLRKKSCKYLLTGVLPNDCAILVNLRAFIVWPETTNDIVDSMQITTTGRKWWTLPYRDANSKNLQIVGYACYVRHLWTEMVAYPDPYPDVQPQSVSSVSLNMLTRPTTAIWNAERTDFVFEITAPYWYYIERIVILFPATFQWKLYGDLCKENVNSQIEINSCWIEANAVSPRIWIDVAHKNSLNLMTLRIETQMESFQVPKSAPQQILYSDFNLKFYTWSPNPHSQVSPWRAKPSPIMLDPLTDAFICFTDSSRIRQGESFPTQSWNNDFQGDENIYFDYSYHRYFDEFVPCSNDQRAPLKFDMILPDSMQDLQGSVNYHTLHIYYQDKFEIPQPTSVTDYIQDKLICYINNERAKCVDDNQNKRISMFFKQKGYKNDNVFISATSYDINDITKDGFKYKANLSLTNFKYEMQIFSKPENYYGYSSMFPALYNTMKGQIQCPHRGIEDGELERSNNVYGRLNIIWLKLKFDRIDIQGLTIMIRIKDEDGLPIQTSDSFFNLQSGSNYPCSRGVSNGQLNSVRCIYESGFSDLLSTPHKIHMFDFSYQVQTWEKFGFMYNNQIFTTQNIFIDIVVQAWGGNPTFENPYGNQFMGEMKFEQIIRLQTNVCGSNCNNVGSVNARMIPSKPAFTDLNTLTFSNDCPANSQAHAVFEVVLQRKSAWDSSEIEECTIDPRQNVSEMYIYENYSWDNSNASQNDYVKKAYLYYDFSQGRSNTVTLGFVKCKHYREPIYGYYSCVAPSDNAQGDTVQFEKVTYSICEESTGNCASSDTNEAKAEQNTQDIDSFQNGVDWKQDFVGATDNMNTISLKLSRFIPSQWTGNFQAVLTLTFPSYYYNIGKGRPSFCQVIEGMRISDPDRLAQPVLCEVLASPTDTASNAFMFKITNWDTIVDEEYVRILYKMSFMDFSGWDTYYDRRDIKILANLYASESAYNNGKNGHMAARKTITVLSRLQSPKDDSGLTVNSFQVVGASTVLKLTSKNVGGEVTFKDNTGTCEYFPYFQLVFYGLQEYEQFISPTVKWEINGKPSPCSTWTIWRKSKGYVSMIVQFDKINDECQFGRSWKDQVLTLEFTFNTVIKMDRNFWWVHFSLNEEYKPPIGGIGCDNITMQLYGSNDEYSYTSLIGAQTTVATLSNQYDTITEVEFTITGLNADVGLDKNVNKVVMMEFQGKDWSDNPIYKTPDTTEFFKVNCLCKTNSATSWSEQICMRRTRQTVNSLIYDPAVFIFVSAKQGDKLACSVPEIQIGPVGSASARNLSFKIVKPSLYEWYSKSVEAYKSSYTTVVGFPCVSVATAPTKLSVTHNPADFYIKRETTELFEGYYDVQIKDISNLDKPFIQVRNGELGPMMSQEFCSDSGIWDPTSIKVYNVHTHLLICRRINSMTTYATIGAGKNLQFEFFKSQFTDDYKYTVYVYANQNLVHLQDSSPILNSYFVVTPTRITNAKNMIYSANNADDQAMFALSVNLNDFTLKDIRHGGRLEILIPRSQVRNISPNCLARLEYQISNILYCHVDNRDSQSWIIVIHSQFQNITSVRLLNVYFNMQNPSTTTQKFDYTVKLYYSWTSDSNFKLQMIGNFTQTDFNLQEQIDGKLRLGNQNIKFYGFRIKQFVTGLQEARFYVKFLTTKSLKLNFDLSSIENKLSKPNGKLRVRLREYHPTIFQKYSEIITPNKQVVLNGFNIGAHDLRALLKNSVVEIIISSIGDNQQIGLPKADTDPAYYDGNIFVYDDTVKNEHQTLSKYRDFSTNQQTDALYLENLYYTNQIHNQITSFSIGIRIKVACTENYPRAYIELKFPQLNMAQTFQGTLQQGSVIPCQIAIALEVNSNRVNSARCVVYDINTSSYSGMMVRVEEFNTFPSNTLVTLSFDDWTLPVSTDEYLPLDIEFNFYNGWPNSNMLEYKRYFLLLKEVIIVDGMHSSIWKDIKLGNSMFSKPSSYTLGDTNQSMNSQISDWLTPTARYNQSTSPGHKIRLVFNQGFAGGDNTPDSLTYFDNEQQLPLLFFNRKTNSAYLSAPKQINDPQGLKAQINIQNITNPYAYQRDQWGSNGLVSYNLFFGDNSTFDGNGFHQVSKGEISLSQNGMFQQYTRPFPRISCDSSATHTVDIYPTYKSALGQKVTMHFKIIHSISKAERQKRKLQKIRLEFKQGVSSISACYIQSDNQDNKAIVHSHQYCTVDQNSSNKFNLALNLLRISEYDDVNPYSIFVEMILSDVQLQYEMTTIVQNGEIEYYQLYNVPLLRTDPTLFYLKSFNFAEEKYIPRYFELGYKQLYTSQPSSSTWRLRFRFTLDIDLVYNQTFNYTNPFKNSDFLRINLQVDALDSYIPTDPKSEELDCYFIEELSLFGQYFVSQNKLAKGTKYLVHIKEHKTQSNSSFQLPRLPRKSEFVFMCNPYNSTDPTIDTLVSEISGQFMSAKVSHLTTTSDHFDVAEITFTPSQTLPSQLAGTEAYLQLEIDPIYYQQIDTNYQDFSIIDSYLKDGLGEFVNDNDHSFLFIPQNTNAKSIINFGQLSNNQFYSGWIKIMLVNSYSLLSNSEYTFKVPMLKNPSPNHTSLNFRLSTVYVKQGDQRLFTLDEYLFINHAYIDSTPATDMTSANYKLTATNDFVQSSNMLINISLRYPISFNQKQKIVLKYDNNLLGINRISLLQSQIKDCSIDVYDKIFLIVITPTNYQQGQGVPLNSYWSEFIFSNPLTTADFRQQYGFSYVYLTKNSVTTNYFYPQNRNWLQALTDVTPDKMFTRISSGFNTIKSINYYQITISTPPRMPANSYIIINLTQDMQTSERFCYPVSNINYGDYSTSKIGSLSCYMLTPSSYILTGLDKYTSSQSLTIRFFSKNLNGGYKVNLASIVFYGGQSEDNKIAVVNNIDGVIVLSSNIGLDQVNLVKHVSYPLNAMNWQKLDFVFNNRIATMNANNDYTLRFTLPPGWFSAFGSNLQVQGRYQLLDKPAYDSNKTYGSVQQDKKCINWVTSQYFGNTPNPLSSNDNLSFGIDVSDPPLSHYTIQSNTDYLFSINSEGSQVPFQEGIFAGQPYLYAFYLEVLNSNLLIERTYNEFYLPPSEDINDTFRVQVLNRGAGQKTMIRFMFTMNYNVAQKGDEIHISFQTFDRYQRVFKDDLGVGFDSDMTNIGCSEAYGIHKISDNRILCTLQKGSSLMVEKESSRGKNAVIIIPISKNIADTEEIEFWIANIENPQKQNQIAGIKLSIRRNCRNDSPHFKCVLYHGEYQYTTIAPLKDEDYLLSTGYFLATPNNVTLQASHSFTFKPRKAILPNQYILIQYPPNHRNRNTCSSLIGQCIEFSESNWVLFKPNAVMLKDYSISIILDNMFNGLYRSNPEPNNNFIFQVFGTQGQIVEPLKISQGSYDYFIQNITGSIINTQTYDESSQEKWVFLKENYQNVAQLDVVGLYIEKEIQYFRLQKPKQASQLIVNYCNATLTIPEANRQPYPIRFNCEIFKDYLMISRLSNDNIYYGNYSTYSLRVYFKFIIDDQIPPTNGFLPGPADPFVIYSCVQRCDDLNLSSNLLSYSHVSKASINWEISSHQQPNLDSAGFYEKTFSQREAKINDQVGFSMLVKPNTKSQDCNITKFVFTIPDQFLLPRTLNLDLCSIIGVQGVPVESCSILRRGGKSMINMSLKGTFGDLAKMVTISDKEEKNLFTAPGYPGTFFPIKLDMFCGQQLVETQYTNITNVKGIELDASSIKVLNSLDELTPQLYEFQFKTGEQQTPIGYQRYSLSNIPQPEIFSSIKIVFDWVNQGYTIHSGYSSDLGMNIADSSEVGCSIKSGLTVSQNSRLKCILQTGNNEGKMPTIVVSGYEQIPPFTTVNILVSNIQSIAQNASTTIKIGIQITDPESNNSAYLYSLAAVVPDPTSALSVTQSLQAFTVKPSGNNQILSTSIYEITLTSSSSKILKQNDYFGISFPNNFIGTTTNGLIQVSCNSTCSSIYAFPASSMIYIQPTADILPNTQVKFQLSGVPNPDYAFQGIINISAFTFIDRKIDTVYNTTSSSNFVPSNIFSSALVEASSQTGGETNVEYSFIFILGHYVPPNGVITVQFPKDLYENPKSMATPFSCELKVEDSDDAFGSNSKCDFFSSHILSINLGGTQLSQTTQYTVILKGITNPNTDPTLVSDMNFIFSTYFSSNPAENKVIAQKQVPPPPIYLTELKKCSLFVLPQFKNVNLKSFYTFKFNCKVALKEMTSILITLPQEYRVTNVPGDYICSSFESTTLFSSKCTIEERGGNVILATQIRSKKHQETFSINVSLNNPNIPKQSYFFTAEFVAYGQKYAVSDNSGMNYANIVLNPDIILSNLEDYSNQISLQNIPINAAEPAYYIFKTPNMKQIQRKGIDETIITFPEQFIQNLGDDLKCFIYQQTDESYKFSMKKILELKARVSLDINNFFTLPCKLVKDYTISITEVNNVYSRSDIPWNYIIIQNVYNPGSSQLYSYSLIHSTEGIAQWIFQGSLHTQISEIPNQLDISSISAKYTSSLKQSPYTFQTQSIVPQKKSVMTGIMIELPDYFDMPLQPKEINCFSSISLSIKTNCNLYNNTIFSWRESIEQQDLYQFFYVNSLINPSIADPCSDSSTQKSSFKISLIDLSTNQIIAANNPKKPYCMKYSEDLFSIKINGPTKLVRGLSYQFTMDIEKPADYLKLVPLYKNPHLEIKPNILLFEDYSVPASITFTLNIFSQAQLGECEISFQKFEYRDAHSMNIVDQYQLPPILKFEVIDSQTLKQPPKVIIQDHKFYSVGGFDTVFVTITHPPAKSMYLNIGITNTKNLTVSPTSLLITSQTKELNFTMQYGGEKIIEPIPIFFSLSSSLEQVVHQVEPSVKYVVISQSQNHKGKKVAKLDFINQLPIENQYKKDVGKSIDSSLLNTDHIKPQILQIKPSLIKENRATLQVVASQQSSIKYTIQYKNSKEPKSSEEIQFSAPSSKLKDVLQYGHSHTKQYFPEAQDHSGEIILEGLSHQTSYDLFAVCHNGMGVSQIYKYSFTTTYPNNGAVFHVSLHNNTQPSVLIHQLSSALRIHKQDLSLITSEELTNNQGNRLNNDLFSFEVAIAPKLNGEDVHEYLKQLKTSDSFQNSLRNHIDGFESYRIEPFTRKFINQKTQLTTIQPKIESVSFYSATVSIRLWKESLVYGIVLEHDSVNKTKQIISQQIIYGFDEHNQPIDSYWQAQAHSSVNNGYEAQLFFDNLKDDTTYEVFITASNVMPFPDHLKYMRLSDDQVVKTTFTTPQNLNVDRCLMIDELKNINIKLSNIVEKRYETDRSFGYCKRVIPLHKKAKKAFLK